MKNDVFLPTLICEDPFFLLLAIIAASVRTEAKWLRVSAESADNEIP